MGRVSRLGVLGGTFDPIHIGHLLMAQTAYEALDLDLVLFVPAGAAPHREPKRAVYAGLRLAMVRAAVEDDDRFAVSTVDLDRPPPHYTADTLALLADDYRLDPDSLFFIMGSDSLALLHTWYRPDLVAARSLLAVVHRPGYPMDLADMVRRVPESEGRAVMVEMPQVGISSTQLRAMVRGNRSIRYWVPPAVERLIAGQGLYRQTAGTGASVAG